MLRFKLNFDHPRWCLFCVVCIYQLQSMTIDLYLAPLYSAVPGAPFPGPGC